MIKLKKYKNYLLDLLIESVLVSSKEFKDILSDMPRNNKIADRLYSMIDDKDDIKTTYNYINQSDKNDEISFIPDNQYQRFKEKGEDLESKTKNKAKIGRMVRQILKDNGYSFTESDIETFVNQFKATWNVKHGVGRKIEIVKGDDIIHWYNESNYFKNEGTLGNSCMRYAHKSEFMRIYADNPDKISMIILKQDDKLMARALVWQLDDGRIYLDRIYVIQDSEFEFVYNWALKNIGNDNPNNMPSHYKGGGRIMKCSLKKAVEEQYPYADSMYYLYQEVDENGQLTGSGFTSNEYNENDMDSYDGYLVRVIQNTDGGSNIQNYKYSDYLKRWISSTEATWASDVDSWVNEDLTVLCNHLSERFLKSNCVYNDIVKDWIPKSKMEDHETYGPILNSMLVNILVAYTGDKTDPLATWFDIESSGSSVVKIVRDLKSGGPYETFRPNRSPIRSLFSGEFKVMDYQRDNQVDFLSYPMYQVVSPSQNSDLSAIFFEYNNRIWVTQLDAEVFGVEVNKESTSWISAFDYLRNFNYSIFTRILKLIDKSNASQNLKSKRIEIAETIHNWQKEDSNRYAFMNDVAEKMPDANYIEIYGKIFNEAFESLESNSSWNYRGDTSNMINYILACAKGEYPRMDTDSTEIKTTIKYFKLYMFFYSLCGDTYDAASILRDFVRKYDQEDYQSLDGYIDGYGDNAFYLIRRVLRYNADDQIRSEVREYMDSFASKNEIHEYNYRSYIKEFVWSELTENPLNPNQIEFLSQFVMKK